MSAWSLTAYTAPVKSALEQVVEDLAADRPAVSGRADHRYRPGLQDAANGGYGRGPLSFLERSSAAGTARSAYSIANASGVERTSTGNPLSRKTSIIRLLEGRTSAVNVVILFCWRPRRAGLTGSSIFRYPARIGNQERDLGALGIICGHMRHAPRSRRRRPALHDQSEPIGIVDVYGPVGHPV